MKSSPVNVVEEGLIVDQGGQRRNDYFCRIGRRAGKSRGSAAGHIERQLQRCIGCRSRPGISAAASLGEAQGCRGVLAQRFQTRGDVGP